MYASFVRVEKVLGTRYVDNLKDGDLSRRTMADVKETLRSGREIPTEVEGWVCPAA
jgi:hypothetical protein